MDYTQYEPADLASRVQLSKVELAVLNETDKNTIYNVIIEEEDRDNADGK